MPPLIGYEESNKELVEDDGVAHHWPEDMLCHASAYWM